MANAKRTLQFERLEDAVSELDNLAANGYTSAGNWNLAQTCEHLENWISFPVNGFPSPGLLMGSVLWIMKHTVGKRQLKSILINGFSNGLPTLPATVSVATCDADHTSLEKLKTSVHRFLNHSGDFHPSPLFGSMEKDHWNRLQLRHFEQHIGFLLPKQ